VQIRIARPGFPYVLGAVVIAAALSVTLAPVGHGASTATMTMKMNSSRMQSTSMHSRFEYLAQQHSNNCGLQPSAFATMAAAMRLQGACCGPMDAKLYPDYVKQLNALAKYDHRYVPSNPYDMSVALARRLVSFNDTILLTPAQQKVYDQAFKFAPDHAPCCCHCWRWTAFEGQAKFLIARREYTAKEIGTLWGLDDGCGDTSAGMKMTS